MNKYTPYAKNGNKKRRFMNCFSKDISPCNYFLSDEERLVQIDNGVERGSGHVQKLR